MTVKGSCFAFLDQGFGTREIHLKQECLLVLSLPKTGSLQSTVFSVSGFAHYPHTDNTHICPALPRVHSLSSGSAMPPSPSGPRVLFCEVEDFLGAMPLTSKVHCSP